MRVGMGSLEVEKDYGSDPARWPATGLEPMKSNERSQALDYPGLSLLGRAKKSGTQEINYKVSFQVRAGVRPRVWSLEHCA